jgi:hypothetical protein
MAFRKYKTKKVNNFIYRSRSNDPIKTPLSSCKQSMGKFCLFEEFIYNLFVHFAIVSDHNDNITLPVFFQKNRICFNDNIKQEMTLMERFYSKFRQLGKGEGLELHEGFSGADKEVVDRVWMIKIEFFKALKDFQRTDILPLRSDIKYKKVEKTVWKKRYDVDSLFRSRTKNVNIVDSTIDNREINPFSTTKKVTKLKRYVEKTFLGNSNEKPQKKSKPKLSRATRRLMSIRRLMKVTEHGGIKIRHFSLKKESDVSKLLLSNLNVNSTVGITLPPVAKRREEKEFFRPIPFDQNRRKSIVENYLRKRFVTGAKLF